MGCGPSKDPVKGESNVANIVKKEEKVLEAKEEVNNQEQKQSKNEPEKDKNEKAAEQFNDNKEEDNDNRKEDSENKEGDHKNEKEGNDSKEPDNKEQKQEIAEEEHKEPKKEILEKEHKEPKKEILEEKEKEQPVKEEIVIERNTKPKETANEDENRAEEVIAEDNQESEEEKKGSEEDNKKVELEKTESKIVDEDINNRGAPAKTESREEKKSLEVDDKSSVPVVIGENSMNDDMKGDEVEEVNLSIMSHNELISPDKRKVTQYNTNSFISSTKSPELASGVTSILKSYQPIEDISLVKLEPRVKKYYDYAKKLHKEFGELIEDSRWELYDRGENWAGYTMTLDVLICSKSVGKVMGTPIEVNIYYNVDICVYIFREVY